MWDEIDEDFEDLLDDLEEDVSDDVLDELEITRDDYSSYDGLFAGETFDPLFMTRKGGRNTEDIDA
jgi:hypothetical protein